MSAAEQNTPQSATAVRQPTVDAYAVDASRPLCLVVPTNRPTLWRAPERACVETLLNHQEN
jgi:hypothetical protein